MPSQSGVTSPFTITGLPAGSVWDVRVRADSPALGPWSAAVQGTVGGYDGEVLADSPSAFWNSSSTTDTVSSITGTLNGTPAVTTLPNGDTALKYDGQLQYMQIPDADIFSVPTTGRLTVEAWVRPDVLDFAKSQRAGLVNSADGDYVWMFGKGEPNQQEWAARMYNLTPTSETARPNRISGYVFSLDGGLGTGSYFQDVLTAGVWIHYVAVINTVDKGGSFPNGYVKIYRDGVLRDQDDLFATAAIVPANGTAPVRVGTRDLNSYFEGAVGKLAFYPVELAASRIAAHHAAMTG